MKTDTAHLAWNDRWSTQQGRADWLTPEPDVAEFATQIDRARAPGRCSTLAAALGDTPLPMPASDWM